MASFRVLTLLAVTLRYVACVYQDLSVQSDFFYILFTSPMTNYSIHTPAGNKSSLVIILFIVMQCFSGAHQPFDPSQYLKC